MDAGPLPSGISLWRVLPWKRRRRSKADAILHALSAPVKMPVAVACRASNAMSLAGVMSVAPSTNRRCLLHRSELPCEKVIGAREEDEPLGFGGRCGHLG